MDESDVKKIRLANNLYKIVDINGRSAIAPEYETNRLYYSGDVVFHGDDLLVCLGNTSGEFDASKWRDISAFGGLGNFLKLSAAYSSSDSLIDFYETLPSTGREGTYTMTFTYLPKEGLAVAFSNTAEYIVVVEVTYYDGTLSHREELENPTGWNIYDGTTVTVEISRIDGEPLNFEKSGPYQVYVEGSDGRKITHALSVIRRPFSTTGNHVDIANHVRGSYTVAEAERDPESWNLNYVPLHPDEKPVYPVAYPADEYFTGAGYSWSDWIPADGGRLLVFHEYNSWHMVDAVYEEVGFTSDRMGSEYKGLTYVWNIATEEVGRFMTPFEYGEENFFEVPGMIYGPDYGGYNQRFKLVAFQVGSKGTAYEMALSIYKKPDTLPKNREQNNPDAVQQFLRLAESWAECFPTRDIVDAFNLKEVKIGVPGFFDVGTSECLNSASFVMACLKGIEPYELGGHYPGEYENDSWNQTGFRYPWAVNPCLDIPGPKYFVYVQ